MAVIYVRLPHYVASFLRNLDEENAIDPATPIELDRGDPLNVILQYRLMPNVRKIVNPACFSEEQWKAMEHGRRLVNAEGPSNFKIHRKKGSPLTMAEIYHLCNKDSRIKLDKATGEVLGDESYPEEYVAFILPRTVIINGREMKVKADFMMPDASDFIGELRDRFRMAFARFLAIDREICHSLAPYGLRRSKLASIDRFLLRYNIRYNDQVREQMKKLKDNSLHKSLYSFDADDVHGRWSEEHIDDPRIKYSHYKVRPVFCETTGIHYESIKDFQIAHKIPYHRNVIRALKNHWKIHGVYVRYEE